MGDDGKGRVGQGTYLVSVLSKQGSQSTNILIYHVSCNLALQKSQTLTEHTQIKRQRALIHQRLGNYESVISDLDFCQLGTSHPIAEYANPQLSLIITALWKLNRHTEAFPLTQILLSRNPKTTNFQNIISRSVMVNEEYRLGTYDFLAMQEEAKTLRPPLLEHASYQGPIEVRDSEGKGKGVFATRNVKVGELLLCEKALVYSYSTSLDEMKERNEYACLWVVDGNGEAKELENGFMAVEAPLLNSAVQVLSRSPSLLKQFLELHHGGYRYETNEEVEEVDGMVPIDT